MMQLRSSLGLSQVKPHSPHKAVVEGSNVDYFGDGSKRIKNATSRAQDRPR